MLNEEPEKNDANFIENPDDIVGWNGIRLHSADEFRTYQHFHDEIPVKSIKNIEIHKYKLLINFHIL